MEPCRSNRLDTARMLVVEDDADIRAMIGTILEAAGAIVTLAAGAPQALQALESTQFDAVVLDWNLTGTNSAKLFAALSERSPPLRNRTVVITGDFIGLGAHHEAESYGCQVVTKPFRPADLIGKLVELMP